MNEMSSNNQKTWEFIFKPSFVIISVDILLRILLMVFFWISQLTSIYVVVGLNILTTIIIFNIALKRRNAIESFLKMRLISESVNLVEKKIKYNEVKLRTRIWKLKDNYKMVLFFLISPFLSTLSLLFPYLKGEIDAIQISTIIIFLLFNIFLLFTKRDVFISKKVISIKLDSIKFEPTERQEIISFLNKKSISNVIKYLSDANDVIILDLQTKVKIYRERLENISFEAIFLGALTFATFAQLINNNDILLSVKSFFLSPTNKSGVSISHGKILKETFLTSEMLLDKHFIPLIVIGCLFSSVFYVVLLLKRFAILKSIEFAQLKIEKANSWNIREENLRQEHDLESFQKAIKFTDQIQIELAQANQMCSEINSNLNVLTIMRLSGIICFFIVLLLSAKYINFGIYLSVLFITFYGIIVALLINKTIHSFKNWIPIKWSIYFNSSNSFSHVLSEKEKQQNLN